VRIAVRAGDTGLTDLVTITSSRYTFPVAENALEKGAIWITELSWEFDIGEEVLEMTSVPRAGTIILHGRAVDEGSQNILSVLSHWSKLNWTLPPAMAVPSDCLTQEVMEL
jgi:hypothetical protein